MRTSSHVTKVTFTDLTERRVCRSQTGLWSPTGLRLDSNWSHRVIESCMWNLNLSQLDPEICVCLCVECDITQKLPEHEEDQLQTDQIILFC